MRASPRRPSVVEVRPGVPVRVQLPECGYYFPKMPGFVALASHTIGIQFLFRNWHGGNLGVNLDQTTGQPRQLNAAELQLSDQMIALWTRFISTGNPNPSGDPRGRSSPLSPGRRRCCRRTCRRSPRSLMRSFRQSTTATSGIRSSASEPDESAGRLGSRQKPPSLRRRIRCFRREPNTPAS